MSAVKERIQLWVIISVVFFGYVGLSMPYLLFPSLFLNPDYASLAEGWGMSSRSIVLGVTLAAYPLGQFLGAPILGVLSDLVGRRRVLVISLLGASSANLGTAVSLQASCLSMVILTRFLAGLMEGNLAIARAVAAQLRTLDKRMAFGRIDAFAGAAYVVGPMMGGLLADPALWNRLSVATPFYVVCLLFLVVAGKAHGLLSELRPEKSQTILSLRERFALRSRLHRLLQNAQLRRSLAVVSIYAVGVDIFYEFGFAYVSEMWGLEPAQLAGLNAVLSVSLALSSGWLSIWAARRFSQRLVIQGAMMLFSASIVGVVFAKSLYPVAALLVTVGIGIAVAISLLTVQVSNAATAEAQGETMGVLSSLRVLGDAIICLTGGLLFAVSPAGVLAVAVGLSTLALYLFSRPQVSELPAERLDLIH